MRAAVLVVAALTACAQPQTDPGEVLHRARARILETIDRLPKYTCVQTVNRSSYERRHPYRSCRDVPARQEIVYSDSDLSLVATDRLRLDVAVSDTGREIFSWAGADRFESGSIPQIIGGGVIGTGPFGPFLIDIFDHPGVTFTYQDARAGAGDGQIEYRFRVPQEDSHYDLLTAGQHRFLAYEGSFRLDVRTAELTGLCVHVPDLPEELGMCDAATTMEFHRVRIGAREYLLPSVVRLHYLGIGTTAENETVYSDCREYRSESSIRFDTAPATDLRAEGEPKSDSRGLARGLAVSLVLETELDSATAAAGDRVTARVQKDVLSKKSKQVLVPAGAMVRGRLTRMEHRMGPPAEFVFGILFDTLETGGTITPFAAQLSPGAGLLSKYTVNIAALANAGRREPSEDFSVGRTLVFRSAKSRYVLPRGYRSNWVTVAAGTEPGADNGHR